LTALWLWWRPLLPLLLPPAVLSAPEAPGATAAAAAASRPGSSGATDSKAGRGRGDAPQSGSGRALTFATAAPPHAGGRSAGAPDVAGRGCESPLTRHSLSPLEGRLLGRPVTPPPPEGCATASPATAPPAAAAAARSGAAAAAAAVAAAAAAAAPRDVATGTSR
jgi:hypothetical protein